MRRVRKLGEANRMGVGSWDIGYLTGKLQELVDAAIRRCVNILYVQEIKMDGSKGEKRREHQLQAWVLRVSR
jgi:hypothetical protein